jgi:hypothetical protein
VATVRIPLNIISSLSEFSTVPVAIYGSAFLSTDFRCGDNENAAIFGLDIKNGSVAAVFCSKLSDEYGDDSTFSRQSSSIFATLSSGTAWCPTGYVATALSCEQATGPCTNFRLVCNQIFQTIQEKVYRATYVDIPISVLNPYSCASLGSNWFVAGINLMDSLAYCIPININLPLEVAVTSVCNAENSNGLTLSIGSASADDKKSLMSSLAYCMADSIGAERANPPARCYCLAFYLGTCLQWGGGPNCD